MIMRSKKPFTVQISDKFKLAAVKMAVENQCHYGVMFSTSGKPLMERENVSRNYDYVWSTREGFRIDKAALPATRRATG